MKKFLGLGLVFVSTMSWSVTRLNVENFNFNYQDGVGVGTASVFDVEKNRAQVNVNRVGNSLEFTSPLMEENFVWENAPAMITDSKIEAKGISINLDRNLDIRLGSGEFVSEERMSIENLSAQCSRAQSSDIVEALILGCLNDGVLKVAQFNSVELNKFVSLMSDELNSMELNVRSLNLNVKNKAFNLSLTTKIGINGTIKARGTSEVNLEEKKASIRVNEVKFGFLNITSKFFDEVSKMKVEGLEVRRPFIYYQMK